MWLPGARFRDVGPKSRITATDSGEPDSPTPAVGLESHIKGMLTHDRSAADEVRQLVIQHARRLWRSERLDLVR